MDVRGAGVAAVLAVGIFAAMAALTGVAQAVVIYGVAVAQVVLLVVRSRSGSVSRAPRFLAVWSVQAGLTYLWAGDGTAASALIYVLVGVVFAAAVTWFLAHAGTFDDHAPARPTDTRPLRVTALDAD